MSCSKHDTTLSLRKERCCAVPRSPHVAFYRILDDLVSISEGYIIIRFPNEDDARHALANDRILWL